MHKCLNFNSGIVKFRNVNGNMRDILHITATVMTEQLFVLNCLRQCLNIVALHFIQSISFYLFKGQQMKCFACAMFRKNKCPSFWNYYHLMQWHSAIFNCYFFIFIFCTTVYFVYLFMEIMMLFPMLRINWTYASYSCYEFLMMIVSSLLTARVKTHTGNRRG